MIAQSQSAEGKIRAVFIGHITQVKVSGCPKVPVNRIHLKTQHKHMPICLIHMHVNVCVHAACVHVLIGHITRVQVYG